MQDQSFFRKEYKNTSWIQGRESDALLLCFLCFNFFLIVSFLNNNNNNRRKENNNNGRK
jgi:hypothetical protein